jgi:hypothetical protein
LNEVTGFKERRMLERNQISGAVNWILNKKKKPKIRKH